MRAGGPILVVDDDQDIREMLSLVLDLHGYESIGGVDGVDALEKVHQGPRPAAILVDLMMPRMNGVDFVKALRDEPALASIPVVILSGDAAVRRTAKALAVEGCLTKPVDLDQLLLTVRGVLSDPAA